MFNKIITEWLTPSTTLSYRPYSPTLCLLPRQDVITLSALPEGDANEGEEQGKNDGHEASESRGAQGPQHHETAQPDPSPISQVDQHISGVSKAPIKSFQCHLTVSGWHHGRVPGKVGQVRATALEQLTYRSSWLVDYLKRENLQDKPLQLTRENYLKIDTQ